MLENVLEFLDSNEEVIGDIVQIYEMIIDRL